MQQEQQELDYSYENFDGSKIESSEPKSKTFQSTQGQQTYHETPLLYNYGTSEKKIIDQCYIEFPAVTTTGGIVYQSEVKKSTKSKNPGEENYNKETYSMMFVFDLKNPEMEKFLKKMDELHVGVAHALVPWKGKIGLRHLDPKNPEATGLKNPVFYKLNQLTNERVDGRNPSIWVKLNHWKNNKTLFTDLEGNPVDWSLLTDVEATMVPLMHVEKVYSGATHSIQFKMISAVILKVVPLNSQSKQVSTMEKYKQKYSGLATEVSSQLARLRMDKQDSLDHPVTLTSGGPAKLPSEGLQSGPSTGQMHSASVGNSSSVDKLNEFLGAAPSVAVQPMQYQQPMQYPPQAKQEVQNQVPLQNQVGGVPTGLQPLTVPQVQNPLGVQQVQLQPSVGVQLNPGQPVQLRPQFSNMSQPALQIQ